MSEVDRLQMEIFSQKVVERIKEKEKEYQNAKSYKKASIYRQLQKYKNDLKKIKGDIHVK